MNALYHNYLNSSQNSAGVNMNQLTMGTTNKDAVNNSQSYEMVKNSYQQNAFIDPNTQSVVIQINQSKGNAYTDSIQNPMNEYESQGMRDSQDVNQMMSYQDIHNQAEMPMPDMDIANAQEDEIAIHQEETTNLGTMN